MRSEQKLVVERLANGGLAVKEVGPHSINHGHIVMQKSKVLHQQGTINYLSTDTHLGSE